MQVSPQCLSLCNVSNKLELNSSEGWRQDTAQDIDANAALLKKKEKKKEELRAPEWWDSNAFALSLGDH